MIASAGDHHLHHGAANKNINNTGNADGDQSNKSILAHRVKALFSKVSIRTHCTKQHGCAHEGCED